MRAIGNATLYLGDCRDILPMRNSLPAMASIDAVVTDPPYGIDYDPTQYNGNFSTGVAGDEKEFDPSFVLSIGSTQILWGANNYSNKLPRGGWFCWDKRCSEAADRILGSPFELAWINNSKKYKMARILHAGKLNADGNDARREHPTQKPITLMQWCIDQLPKEAELILDPYMGSGTTGVACMKMGKKFIGIEIDPRHFEVACRRIEEAQRQGDMFLPALKPPVGE